MHLEYDLRPEVFLQFVCFHSNLHSILLFDVMHVLNILCFPVKQQKHIAIRNTECTKNHGKPNLSSCIILHPNRGALMGTLAMKLQKQISQIRCFKIYAIITLQQAIKWIPFCENELTAFQCCQDLSAFFAIESLQSCKTLNYKGNFRLEFVVYWE